MVRLRGFQPCHALFERRKAAVRGVEVEGHCVSSTRSLTDSGDIRLEKNT